MTIRWTHPANGDFLGIVSWIAANNPAAAATAGRLILGAVEQLRDFPFRGKPGRSPDTRELVIPGLPYLVVYGVELTPAANGGHSPGSARGHVVAACQGMIPTALNRDLCPFSGSD
jgi:toxin ParE1/3/4